MHNSSQSPMDVRTCKGIKSAAAQYELHQSEKIKITQYWKKIKKVTNSKSSLNFSLTGT